jgi:hypothetical protein
VKKFQAKYGDKFTKNFRGFVAQQMMAKASEKTELGIDNETVEIEGSEITSTELTEVATELKLETQVEN